MNLDVKNKSFKDENSHAQCTVPYRLPCFAALLLVGLSFFPLLVFLLCFFLLAGCSFGKYYNILMVLDAPIFRGIATTVLSSLPHDILWAYEIERQHHKTYRGNQTRVLVD